MKKNKIIGIAIASLGILFSIGGAFALYTRAAENVTFHITPGVYTGSTSTVTYKINNNDGNPVAPVYADTGEGENQKFDGTALNDTYSQIKYEFTLGAQYANDIAQQDFVLGNIKVEVKNIPSAFRGNLTIWAGISGYQSNSLGEVHYASPLNGDFAITSEEGHTEYSQNADIAVASNGTQKLVVWLKYTFGEGHLDTMTLDEVGLGYSLTVTWDAPSNAFEKAYVTGNKVMWADDDEYVMLPNINKANSEGWEWIYNNLSGTMGEAKCHSTKAGLANSGYSAGNNASLDSTKTYTVYWNGNPSSEASFAQIGA